MVTLRKCLTCNHAIDEHEYLEEMVDTVYGKSKYYISNCNVKDCNCADKNREQIKLEAINKKEHG
jgi:hypothetical protein